VFFAKKRKIGKKSTKRVQRAKGKGQRYGSFLSEAQKADCDNFVLFL
jgi:hypothetical protein